MKKKLIKIFYLDFNLLVLKIYMTIFRSTILTFKGLKVRKGLCNKLNKNVTLF